MTIRSPTYQQAKEWPRWLPPDTSRGTPKTLQVEIPPHPFEVYQHTAPDRIRPVVDTSAGTPKVLIPEVLLPIGAAQVYTPPDRIRPVTDTSAGMPKALLPEIVLPRGKQWVESAPPFRHLWWPTETSYGIPKSLLPEIVLPIGKRQLDPLLDRLRPVMDTSSGVPLSILSPVVVPIPAGKQNYVAPAIFRILPADTSFGVPKGLLPEVQLPIRNLQHSAPDRIRPVMDTSASVPLTILAPVVVALPPGQQNYIGPAEFRQWLETHHQSNFFPPPPPPVSAFQVTPGKLPPWPWSWTHDPKQKPDSPEFIRNLQRAMLREQTLRAERARLERQFKEKKLAAHALPTVQQKSALQNREYAILRRKIRLAEEAHSQAVTKEIELRLRVVEYETAERQAVAARRQRELMMVLLLA